MSDSPLNPHDDYVRHLGPHTKEALVTAAQWLRAEGHTEGAVEGRAETVLELLNLKFGPLPFRLTTAIRAADVEQLRLWAARLLTAGTLDDVFQD